MSITETTENKKLPEMLLGWAPAASWQQRLIEAIDAAQEGGVSNRQLTIKAGVGPSFINDLKKMNKTPSAENVLKLARALNMSPVFLFTGFEITPELEELLAIYAELPASRREALLALLKDLQGVAPR